MFLTDRPTVRQIDAGLALLRIVIGIIFLAHGWQKVFTFGFGGVTGAFTQMHVPMPGFTGPAIGILELVGGVALILGVLTRLFGFLLASDMLGAILLVHGKQGFFAPMGMELVLALCVGAATLAIAGGGGYSVDASRRPAPVGA